MSEPSFRILGLSGSLRKGSWNTAALRAAQELAPAGVTIEIFGGMRDVPLYDEDVRAAGLPAPVEALRAAIRGADALMIATPEYNYSVSGVLKNAIDWASRPPEQPFDEKPIAVLGAAAAIQGTARAQYDLRKMFVYLNGRLLNGPEVLIGQAMNKFDAEGRLTDETSRKLIGQQVAALRDWALRLRRGAA